MDGQTYFNELNGDEWLKIAGTWTLYGANAYRWQGQIVDQATMAVPSAGNVPTYDPTLYGGAGGWKAAPGGANTRATTNITSTSLAASGQVKSYKVSIAKTFDILKIVSNLSYPVRLRIYSDATFRDADASRTRYGRPSPGVQHGVIADVVLDAVTGYTWVMSPLARGQTNDGTDRMYYTVDNLDTVSRNIDLTVTYLKGE